MMWLQFKLSSGAWGLELPDEWMFPAETLGASSYLGTIMSDGHHGWLLLDFYLFHFGFAEFLIFMCKKWAVRGKCRTKFSQFRQFEFAQQICTQTRLLNIIIICIHWVDSFHKCAFLEVIFFGGISNCQLGEHFKRILLSTQMTSDDNRNIFWSK